jgi:hypothetical protein
MRPSKYFYDKPLPKYLDSKTVLIYHPHPVVQGTEGDGYLHGFLNVKSRLIDPLI